MELSFITSHAFYLNTFKFQVYRFITPPYSPGEGERCYPKNGKFWEAYLECNGDCVDGTVCTRDDSQPYYGYYVCRTVGSGPEKLCRGS